MNPHFLFNILLTIQIRAKMSGDETLYRMISSLSSLLRAGIYKDKRALISVGEELKYVEYYLWLQKERFEDRLTYSINVSDDSILECEIPRLVIEPMVENAVVHGVENTSDHATICVTLEYEEDTVLIHVIDNGVGFDTSAFETEGERVGTDGTIKREKMGLSNVDQRIKLMYGESYGLTIHSKQNEGTDIAIRIPRKKLEITDDSSNDSR
jgi:two-component system sensor histidine kinase YesM